jgi:hypothetical protein
MFQGIETLTMARTITTLLLEECEDDIHIPKIGTWESTKILETSKFDCRHQNTSHWSFLYSIGNLSKCRYRKWAHMSHLDIFSISYGKKKGPIWLPTSKSRESTRPLCVQVKCNTSLESFQWELQVCLKPRPNWSFEQRFIVSQSYGSLDRDNFGTPPWESQDKKPFGCRCRREAQRILYGGRWGLPPSSSCGESYESRVARGLS